jgi:hypothetical protein
MSYLKKNLPSLLLFIVVCFLISCAPQSPPAEESSSGSEMPMASAPEAAGGHSVVHHPFPAEVLPADGKKNETARARGHHRY